MSAKGDSGYGALQLVQARQCRLPKGPVVASGESSPHRGRGRRTGRLSRRRSRDHGPTTTTTHRRSLRSVVRTTIAIVTRCSEHDETRSPAATAAGVIECALSVEGHHAAQETPYEAVLHETRVCAVIAPPIPLKTRLAVHFLIELC